jgi:hypothetical protein
MLTLKSVQTLAFPLVGSLIDQHFQNLLIFPEGPSLLTESTTDIIRGDQFSRLVSLDSRQLAEKAISA